MVQERGVRLRSRVFSALAIAGVIPLTSFADTGTTSSEETRCLAMESDGSCASPEEALVRLDAEESGGCSVTAIVGEATISGGECCYTAQIECAIHREEMGCYGRRFAGGELAEVEEGEGWAEGPRPSLDGLDDATRAALAEFWLHAARAEHASIAAFHLAALELLHHGAPAALLRDTHRAAVDEERHARLCFSLASAYAGRPLRPRRLRVDREALGRGLAELAVATVADGCVNELLAALVAGEMSRQATDPVVRRVLRTIVRDEERHAVLAWRTVGWLLQVGGAEVREVLATAFVAPRPELARVVCFPAHGLLHPNVVTRVRAAGWEQVVAPLARALHQGVGYC